MLLPTWQLTLLLGIIVILFAFFRTNHPNHRSTIEKREIDEGEFAHFMSEWQQENEALVQTLTEMQNDVNGRLADLQDRIAALEAMTHTEKNSTATAGGQGPNLRQRFTDIFKLAERGMTVPDIARETGHENGEIKLILGLAARGKVDE